MAESLPGGIAQEVTTEGVCEWYVLPADDLRPSFEADPQGEEGGG